MAGEPQPEPEAPAEPEPKYPDLVPHPTARMRERIALAREYAAREAAEAEAAAAAAE